MGIKIICKKITLKKSILFLCLKEPFLVKPFEFDQKHKKCGEFLKN
jgi:hypothetical protein